MRFFQMRKFTIRTRVLLLLAAMALAFIGLAYGWHVLEQQQAQALTRHTRKERAVFYDRLLTLRAIALKNMVYDNSYWDEMVTFVRTHNATWGKQNVDTMLTTYDLDGCWVYDPQMRWVYSSCSSDARHIKHLPLSLNAVRFILQHEPYCHFFMQTQDGLLEVRTASIHDTSDPAHTGPAKGYLLAGRLWDAGYLADLTALTSGKATMLKTSQAGQKPTQFGDGGSQMCFVQDCLGWDGKPVVTLQLLSEDTTAGVLQRSAMHVMALIVGFLLLLLVALSVCLMEWVSVPLWRLGSALATEQAELLTELREDQAEFGTLARLICDFFTQKRELKTAHDTLEERVTERTEQLAEANHNLQAAYDATITGWSRAMDLRDHETEGHSQRVTEMTLRLARSLGISEKELIHIQRGALLHDIGKMGVPDHILRKTGPLTSEEWVEMRLHPTYAYEMLSPIAFLQPALDIPYCHHEQWSGDGYPRGLRENDIPLPARIFSVVDVWDALSSDRPYRPGWPPERVRDHISSLAGTHFDPQVVAAFIRITDAEIPDVATASRPLAIAA